MGFDRWDVIIELVSIVAAGVGTYAAIRSDLAIMHERHGVMKERVDKVEVKVEEHGKMLAYCDRREHKA